MTWDAMLEAERRREAGMDSDRVAASRALADLATRIRNEAHQWTEPQIRKDLNTMALRVEDNARAALHIDPIRSDAYAVTVEKALMVIIGARKLNENIEHEPTVHRAWRTHDERRIPRSLDCRNGIHEGCQVCSCDCHGQGEAQ